MISPRRIEEVNVLTSDLRRHRANISVTCFIASHGHHRHRRQRQHSLVQSSASRELKTELTALLLLTFNIRYFKLQSHPVNCDCLCIHARAQTYVKSRTGRYTFKMPKTDCYTVIHTRTLPVYHANYFFLNPKITFHQRVA